MCVSYVYSLDSNSLMDYEINNASTSFCVIYADHCVFIKGMLESKD